MRKRIGELLVDQGVLNAEQVEEILVYSRYTGLRFGEAGQVLNTLTPQGVQAALKHPSRRDYQELHPRFFPQVTKDLISSETILSCAALPLGFVSERRVLRPDRKFLQLGMVDPTSAASRTRAEVEARAQAGRRCFDGVIVLAVLPQQLMAVLEIQYGFTQDRLAKVDPASVDPVLRSYLCKAG